VALSTNILLQNLGPKREMWQFAKSHDRTQNRIESCCETSQAKNKFGFETLNLEKAETT
jgi:hypothetical protein